MKQIHEWFKHTSTHKCATALVYIGCLIFAIVVFIGWFRGLENAVGMMNCVGGWPNDFFNFNFQVVKES